MNKNKQHSHISTVNWQNNRR